MEYKKYNREEMAEIGREQGFYFIETSNEDKYIIAKEDLADFIVLENIRCNGNADISVYAPSINKPMLTTYGWFLNTINPKLSEEIMDRLVEIQTFQIMPEEVKIFDNEVFEQMDIEEFGEKEGMTIMYDKFFRKYFEEEEEEEDEEEEEFE